MARMTRKEFLALGATISSAAGLLRWPSTLRAASAQSPQTPPARQTPPMQQMAFLVPLAHARFFSGADIVINNNGAEFQRVAPIWHADGRQIPGEPIPLEPLTSTVRPLAEFFPAGVTMANLNGLVVRYEGHAVDQASAHVTLLPGGKMEQAQGLDAPLIIPFDRTGPTLEAVWATPKGDEQSVIALFNVRADARTVKITDATSTSEIRIPPSSSYVLMRPAPTGAGFDWIRFDSDPGLTAIYPSGFTISPKDHAPRIIQFFDPDRGFQSDLYATGVRIQGASVTLALKNTRPIALVATVAVLDPTSGSVILELPAVRLAGRAAALVDLTKLQSPSMPRTAGIRVRSTGVAGSLIADLQSVDLVTGLAHYAPLRNAGVDVGSFRGRTGHCPVRLDGDYDTRLLLTNACDVPVNLTLRIAHDGINYIPPAGPLPVGGSLAFDVRRLRDDQTADSSGRLLSKTMTHAVCSWSTRGMGIEAMLTGRAEIVSVSRRVSSSITW